MNIRKVLLKCAVGFALMGTGYLIGQGPLPPSVDPHRHPNLAAAQIACDQAYAKMMDAQRANGYDMDGHARNAEQLLARATREIRNAAITLDRTRR